MSNTAAMIALIPMKRLRFFVVFGMSFVVCMYKESVKFSSLMLSLPKPMITLRPAEIKDVEILWTLQKEAFLPLWERYHDAGNPYLRGPEDIKKRLFSPQYHCYCILDDARIVGGILYATMANEIEREYYLQRLFIIPEMQNQGIGRKAIALCEHELADATLFTVEFPQDLEKNRTCYTAAGFKDTGRRVETEEGVVLARFEKRIARSRSGT